MLILILFAVSSGLITSRRNGYWAGIETINSTTQRLWRRHGPPLTINQIYADPPIYELSNFLDPKTITLLLSYAQSRFQPSVVIEDGNNVIRNYRTSTSAYFEKGETEVLRLVEGLAAFLVEKPSSHVGSIEIVRYLPGQEYQEHQDYFNEGEGNQRETTILVYLLAPDAGGDTHFPQLEFSYSPRSGNALLWFNIDEDGFGDPRTRYASLPVLSGIGYTMNIWIYTHPV